MTRDNFEVRITDQQDSKEYNLVLAALRDYNASHLKRDVRELTITIFDNSKNLAAGLNGATYWGWLFVEHLWVREDCRKYGLGKRLIALAEAEAKNRGCRHVYLDTFSFQAPEFYKRLGYIEYAKFDDFPGDHSRYFFKKDLVSSSPGAKLLGLDNVLLFVKDVDQSKAWYQKVLGVDPSINIPNFAEFRVGNSALGLHPADEKSPLTTGGQVAYWSVDDFDKTVEHFESHGGTVYRGPLEIEDGRYICQILDPFGNAIGLIGRRTNKT